MNRHERRARAAQYRKSAASWRVGRPDEVLVNGGYDECVKQAGGEQNVVSIVAEIVGSGATLKAAIAVDMIDETLELMRNVAAQQDKRTSDPRQAAMSHVIHCMKRNAHLSQDAGKGVVATLFWLACTRPGLGDAVIARAKEGGALLTWVITEGGKGYGNNWRLILDGFPEDAADMPTPMHPLPTTAGATIN